MSRPRMVPNDDWAVGGDGRMAVVRANGYYVEWLMPDGTVVTGPETPPSKPSRSPTPTKKPTSRDLFVGPLDFCHDDVLRRHQHADEPGREHGWRRWPNR